MDGNWVMDWEYAGWQGIISIAGLASLRYNEFASCLCKSLLQAIRDTEYNSAYSISSMSQIYPFTNNSFFLIICIISSNSSGK